MKEIKIIIAFVISLLSCSVIADHICVTNDTQDNEVSFDFALGACFAAGDVWISKGDTYCYYPDLLCRAPDELQIGVRYGGDGLNSICEPPFPLFVFPLIDITVTGSNGNYTCHYDKQMRENIPKYYYKNSSENFIMPKTYFNGH